ncbi:hypothetical protein DXG01_013348 [Tephrocybe rancida]|nr:hypothetical protein DXG01_013348 [Tephrocybe rancida]
MASFIKRDLFGGAITAQTLFNLVDASLVPDNQEVFLYPDSGVSIIVEILEKVEPSDLNEAIRHVYPDPECRELNFIPRFHFASLAHDNSAASFMVDNVIIMPNDRGDDTPAAILLAGKQAVPKFNHAHPDEVHVFMALYRVAIKGIDLVVTFNVPTKTGDESEVSPEGLVVAQGHFNELARSLQIIDDGLFA